MATSLGPLMLQRCSKCYHLFGRASSKKRTSLLRPTTAIRFLSIEQHRANLWEQYDKAKKTTQAQRLPVDRDPLAVFCNNELDLAEIDVYGFDYDYTLASYKPTLHYLIYNLGRDKLVNDHNYPKDILGIQYDPSFSVRGLHCDVRKGLLLKIDAFHHIQMGTVYRGRRRVSDEEVKELYAGTHVSIDSMNTFYGAGPNMYQLMDLFALPEMTLYSNVIELFSQNNIAFDAEYVFHDVKSAVQGLHSSGVLHSEIMANIGVFLSSTTGVSDLLRGLSAAGKKLFLITNSGVPFVDQGMQFLVGPDWADLFDVIITRARKPKFFYEESRPFREYDVKRALKSWHRVLHLRKGQPYEEGNLYQLQELTGWYGNRVLYFGDHVYSDLADATLKHGWRTGAIIPELEDEIRTMNQPDHKEAIQWLTALESLIQDLQVFQDSDARDILKEWIAERNELRQFTKNAYNEQFGSVFRTFHNPTYFTRRLCRFADIYMSSINNLLHYPGNYTFYPRRGALPHEVQYPSLHVAADYGKQARLEAVSKTE